MTNHHGCGKTRIQIQQFLQLNLIHSKSTITQYIQYYSYLFFNSWSAYN